MRQAPANQLLPQEAVAFGNGFFFYLSCENPCDIESYTLTMGLFYGEEYDSRPEEVVYMNLQPHVLGMERELNQSPSFTDMPVDPALDTTTTLLTNCGALFLPTLRALFWGHPSLELWPTWGDKELVLVGTNGVTAWPDLERTFERP